MSKSNMDNVLHLFKEIDRKKPLKQCLDDYKAFFDEGEKENEPSKRQQNYKEMTIQYYSIVSDLINYAWGESWHFAPRHENETFEQSLARDEQYIALRLGLKPGMKVLDAGCGVGGPMRTIARFSGAKVVGINLFEYQIERGNYYNKKYKMDNLCSFIHGDYMKIPVKDGEFDAIYSVESTCHAPSKLKLFKELYRVLKPGGRFCAYEWSMTDKYDPRNKRHLEIKKAIERGSSLPELCNTAYSIECLEKAGFEVEDAIDFGEPTNFNPVGWWEGLDEKFSIAGFKFTRLGRCFTGALVYSLEKMGIVPAGAYEANCLLSETAQALVDGGKEGIFTPLFFVLARKPEEK